MATLAIQKNLSPNFNDRRDACDISMLVLHYTGMKSAAAALDRLRDPEAEVSAHYVIEENGTIHQLVPDDKRAWHAGVSEWNGTTDINSASIGVEIVNPGHEFGYISFPKFQIMSIVELCQGLVEHYRIHPLNVVGHSDIAPTRKKDPGELFPWKWLAKNGIGYWPEKIIMPNLETFDTSSCLKKIGYDVSDLPKAVAAFQRHWRPSEISGLADPETCRLAATVAHARENLTLD